MSQTMIKKYKQFINEDLRGKEIYTEVKCDNLKSIYPDIRVRYTTDYKIVISSSKKLSLNKEFYDALEKDDIKVDDIIFENCKEIELGEINKFTKILDYGTFGKDIKDFCCTYCYNLTSLDGASKEVGGSFKCHYCKNLTSLKDAPNIVGSDFDCEGCLKLTSLQGSPEIVGGFFDCSRCIKLTNLQGAPKTIGYDFICYDNNPNFIELARQKYGDNNVRPMAL